jgi:pyruvate-ferredoxin/flavodoxin oxidoreductase
VESCEERRDFWILLRDLAGPKEEAAKPDGDIEERIRKEVIGNLAQKLMKLAGGNGSSPSLDFKTTDTALKEESPATVVAEAPKPASNGMAPWLESDECTSCDECINLNPEIFAYNDDKKAFIKNAKGGSYQDLVLAAEKCTAQVIHPGLPQDKSMKDVEKWVKRGEKFN